MIEPPRDPLQPPPPPPREWEWPLPHAGCPDDCRGCNCWVRPPCTHCVDHFNQLTEIFPGLTA